MFPLPCATFALALVTPSFSGQHCVCIHSFPGIVTCGCAIKMPAPAPNAPSSVKRDFQLLHTRTAGRDRWFFRVLLAAMCQHIAAWLIHAASPLP